MKKNSKKSIIDANATVKKYFKMVANEIFRKSLFLELAEKVAIKIKNKEKK